jgi:hypothetical protein
MERAIDTGGSVFRGFQFAGIFSHRQDAEAPFLVYRNACGFPAAMSKASRFAKKEARTWNNPTSLRKQDRNVMKKLGEILRNLALVLAAATLLVSSGRSEEGGTGDEGSATDTGTSAGCSCTAPAACCVNGDKWTCCAVGLCCSIEEHVLGITSSRVYCKTRAEDRCT